MTPARSPLGAFYRSPLGVRDSGYLAAFAEHYRRLTWATGIASDGNVIVSSGSEYGSETIAVNYMRGSKWQRIVLPYAELESAWRVYVPWDMNRVVSVAYGHAGFIAVAGGGYSEDFHSFVSSNGIKWEASVHPWGSYVKGPRKIWYGNGIYVFMCNDIAIYDTSWTIIPFAESTLTTLNWAHLVFHQKTNKYESARWDDETAYDYAAYSSDCVNWTASETEYGHGFIDAAYDSVTDKSIAVGLGNAPFFPTVDFALGAYISDDAATWTQVSGDQYHFCFAGGGRLFFGRPRYFYTAGLGNILIGDYEPKLIMSDDGGSTWQDVTGTHTPESGVYFDPHSGIYFNGRYYLTGRFGSDTGSTGSRVAVSDDGINWTYVENRIDHVVSGYTE